MPLWSLHTGFPLTHIGQAAYVSYCLSNWDRVVYMLFLFFHWLNPSYVQPAMFENGADIYISSIIAQVSLISPPSFNYLSLSNFCVSIHQRTQTASGLSKNGAYGVNCDSGCVCGVDCCCGVFGPESGGVSAKVWQALQFRTSRVVRWCACAHTNSNGYSAFVVFGRVLLIFKLACLNILRVGISLCSIQVD